MSTKRLVSFKSEYAAMLVPFVSTEGPRYYLSGLGVFPHKDKGVLLVATDGHRMGIIHDEAGKTNGDWICPITPAMVRAMIPDMRSAFDEDTGEYKYDDRGNDQVPVSLHFVGDVAYLLNADADLKKLGDIGKHHVCVAFTPAIDGKFPDWRRAIDLVVSQNDTRGVMVRRVAAAPNLYR